VLARSLSRRSGRFVMLEDTIREKADAWVRSPIKPRVGYYDGLSPERVLAAMDVIRAAREFLNVPPGRGVQAYLDALEDTLGAWDAAAWDASGKEEA